MNKATKLRDLFINSFEAKDNAFACIKSEGFNFASADIAINEKDQIETFKVLIIKTEQAN